MDGKKEDIVQNTAEEIYLQHQCVWPGENLHKRPKSFQAFYRGLQFSQQRTQKKQGETEIQKVSRDVFQEIKSLGVEPRGYDIVSLTDALRQLSNIGFDAEARRINASLMSSYRQSHALATRIQEMECLALSDFLTQEALEALGDKETQRQCLEVEKTELMFNSIDSRVKRYQERNKTLRDDTRDILVKLAEVVAEL